MYDPGILGKDKELITNSSAARSFALGRKSEQRRVINRNPQQKVPKDKHSSIALSTQP